MPEVSLLKVESPGEFWIRFRVGEDGVATLQKLSELEQHLNDLSLSVPGRLSSPSPGQNVLVKDKDDRQWYRGRIHHLLQGSDGVLARVFYLDYGQTVTVKADSLRPAPANFDSLDWQAKQCTLHGVKPLSLHFSLDYMQQVPKSGQKWDESARNFFHKSIKDQRLSVEVMDVSGDGVLRVNLYAGKTSVSKLLVAEAYATEAEEDVVSTSPNVTTPVSSATPAVSVAQNGEQYHSTRPESRPGLAGRPLDDSYGPPEKRSWSQPRATKIPSPRITSTSSKHSTSLDDRVLRRLARCLQSVWADLAYELNWSSADINQLKAKAAGSSIEACFMLLKSWQQEDLTGDKLILVMSDAGFVEEAEQAANVLDACLESSRRNADTSRGIQQRSSSDASTTENSRQCATSHPVTASSSNEPLARSSSTSFDSSSPHGHASGICDRPAVAGPAANAPSIADTKGKTPPPPKVSRGRGAAIASAIANLSTTPVGGMAASEKRSPASAGGQTPTSATCTAPVGDRPASPENVSPASDAHRPGPSPAASPLKPVIGLRSQPTGTERMQRYHAVTAPRTAAITKGQSSDESPISSDDRSPGTGIRGMQGAMSGRGSDSDTKRHPRHRGQRSRFDLHCIRQDANCHGEAADEITAQAREMRNRMHESISRKSGGFVLVRGQHTPEPADSVAGVHSFPNALVTRCEKCDLTAARPVQSYCWPAVMRGHDVACVSPRGTGKTLGHCVPLLAKIMNPTFTRSMPKGIGPFIVVLLPSWSKVLAAHAMYDNLGDSTRQNPCRSFPIHGGGSEEEQVTNLINGCEIIIATPASLLRLLQKRQTSLARLCHLVLDDCDQLGDLFTDELDAIMKLLEESLAANSSRSPPQVLLYTSTWTPKVGALNKAYLQNQLTIVCSKLEMAVSTGCNMLAHVTSAESRFTELRRIVDTIAEGQRGDRIVICTSSAQHADRLKEIFMRYSHSVLCAHENLVHDQLETALTHWRTPCSKASVPLLIVTDSVLLKMSIDDAHCVIHFDFPSSKSAFGHRLDCLRKAFLAGQTELCSSHLFISEEDVESAHTIMHLLKRFGSEVPKELLKQSAQAVQLREEKRRSQPLCTSLRQWGACSQFNEGVSSCSMRHVVLEEVDQPSGIPTEGYVKVIVMSVVSASHYWGRIVSHRSLASDVHSKIQNRTYLNLTMDLAIFYSNPENVVQKDDVKVGDLCACTNAQQAYCRARVLEKMQRGARLLVKVHLLDEGREVVVKQDSLHELPRHLAEIIPQAIEIFACRLRPCDQEDHWTPQATELAKTLLNRTLNGKVALSMKGCLWLDPLIEQQMLSNLHVLETTVNIRYELQEKKLASSNPTHLANLTKMMASWAPPILTPKACDDVVLLQRLDQMGLSSEGYTEVIVSHINSPSDFYVQQKKSTGLLEDLQDWIHYESGNPADRPAAPEKLHVGGFVLCHASADDNWYRAKVILRQGEQYSVQYVDFGNKEWRSSEHLRPLLREPQSELPAQAIHCSLADILPAGDEWIKSDQDELDNLVQDKELLAKVREVSNQDSNVATFVVELYDTSSGQDVLVAAELSKSGHGKLLPSALSFLIPESVTVAEYAGQLGDVAVTKLTDFCRCLLHYKDQDMLLELASVVHALVRDNDKYRPEFLKTTGLNLLCRALEVVETDAIREHLAGVLSLLIDCGHGVCESIARFHGIKAMCQFLSPLSEPSLIVVCCSVLRKLAATSQIVRDAVRDDGGVRVLCQLLSQACQDPQVVEAIVSAMIAFAGDSTRNCEALRNEGVVQAAGSIFSQETSVRSHEQASRCLEVIATHCPRAATSFRTTGAIVQLSNVMLQCHNDKSMVQFIRCLKAMIGEDEANIEYASSVGVHEHLRTILSHRCGMVTRGLAMDLQRRVPPFSISTRHSLVSAENINALANRANGTADVDTHDLVVELDGGCQTIRPKIVWAQRRGFLKLSFCVADVVKRQLQVKDNQITFLTVVDRQTYHVELVLFGDVLTSDLQEKFIGTSYSLIVKKKEECFWPRLLHTKVKAPFITLDFDNYDDSDEEEERRQIAELRRQRRRRKHELRNAEGGPDMEDDEEYNSDFDDDSDVDGFFDGYAPF
ncbi:uncharacterized protein LOC135809564 isoform X1 [Sycon ciliatum]|uniref:uncharacterized protein LOC135809564 isoform X1 n=1 Tax=Sycon ciliatum TaxID=27933 RepID=UPI0031F6A27C